ncbi:MAG: tRNA (adenosine(37)-N6)-threonylcarbamoyltransferase complex transferase subunit TsaD, partial [Candidatus Saccharibacteria bacterium]|nr:tRNA (adenosine(37)-N6)-threonylcarbamoyltransferase complex transferase subunit TsaD [Candidatus Saccharibacteria bacterium]
MKILGIETSCDDTCAAIVEDGEKILSNIVSSQVDIFKNYGGVIPEVAARSHLESILPVIHRSLKDAALTITDIDAISVTHTPGLLGSLLIGTLTARTFAIINHKPFYPVHHLKSHIYANWLESDNKPTFPLLALVISGGHTQIIYMKKHNHFEIIGTTLDDAVGECFDKVAKILGLEYPGGPAISKAALSGDRKKYPLPHPKTENPYDFSFSGLKTAVLRSVQKSVNKPISFPSHELKTLLSSKQISDFSASFENTAIDYLLEKLARAKENYEINSLVFAGGVSANNFLREKARKKFPNENIFFPALKLSGDNGAMVASACFYEIQSGITKSDPYSLELLPRSAIS